MVKNEEEDLFVTEFIKEVTTVEEFREASTDIWLGAIRISKLIIFFP